MIIIYSCICLINLIVCEVRSLSYEWYDLKTYDSRELYPMPDFLESLLYKSYLWNYIVICKIYNIKDPESCTVWYYGYGIVWQISMLVYPYRKLKL